MQSSFEFDKSPIMLDDLDIILQLHENQAIHKFDNSFFFSGSQYPGTEDNLYSSSVKKVNSISDSIMHYDEQNIWKEELDEFLQETENDGLEVEGEDELILRYIITENDEEVSKKRRKRYDTHINFWDTDWGKIITNPNVNNPKTRAGKQFRRRFRMPYPVFQYLVKQCSDHNIFSSVYKSKIPIEAKVLGCLRILSRDNCADDVNFGSQG